MKNSTLGEVLLLTFYVTLICTKSKRYHFVVFLNLSPVTSMKPQAAKRKTLLCATHFNQTSSHLG